ncbi:phosphotransferase family protein [Halobacterium litoreum]|uniref:Phosphotransferase family protein n=1 Tax=Halobacterium litoreum TaxID=2039234 RepID=A0ABD5NEU6_9EURY|nr:aminoglycoside phosphotransferase family protein [Halobacterium litoreum]UHH13339.1 aminoglycoside phosphotransferase family protein [Halobacterium litoreum]
MQSTRDALAADFEAYRIERRLHDVPPHEVHEVTVDGNRAVCKRDTGPTGHAGVEGRATAFVGEHTDVPVPDVLAVGTGHYVAAWHPDAPSPDGEHDADEAWSRAAGRGLATLHAQTAPHLDGYGEFGMAGDDLALPEADIWRDAALAVVQARRDVLAEHGHADVADAVLDFLREHPGAFAGAGDSALCHGWWTPAHVAVCDGEVACVVDFEHALAAPGEWDYWRTVLPAFDGGDAQAAFRAGYESVRSLPDGFAARRPLYVALIGTYYVESLYVQDQHGPEATAARADFLRESVFDALDALA